MVRAQQSHSSLKHECINLFTDEEKRMVVVVMAGDALQKSSTTAVHTDVQREGRRESSVLLLCFGAGALTSSFGAFSG